jgi:hypothetical protein
MPRYTPIAVKEHGMLRKVAMVRVFSPELHIIERGPNQNGLNDIKHNKMYPLEMKNGHW